MKTMSITGWTSFPEDCEFVESYTRDDGKRVDHRFTTYVAPVNGNGHDDGGRRVRVNFWGRLARQAKAALMDDPHVALVKVKEARVSNYIDPYEALQRFSLNINLRSEFELLDSRPCSPGNGFEALLGKLEHQAKSQDRPMKEAQSALEFMDESPF